MDNSPSCSFPLKRIILLTILGLILLSLLLYYIPLPVYISLASPGAEVNDSGKIIAEGQIVLEGWRFNYLLQNDTFLLTRLELPNLDILDPINFDNGPAIILNGPKGTDFIWFPCGFLLPSSNGNENEADRQFANISATPDFRYVALSYGGTPTPRIFVTTDADDPTPVEILTEFFLIS